MIPINPVIIYVAAIMALALGLFTASVSGSWTGWRKFVYLGAFLALLGGQAVGYIVLLGKPLPIVLNPFLKIEGSKILSFTPDEPHAMYLTLVPPGEDIPIYVVLPWSDQKAKEIWKELQDGKLGDDGDQFFGFQESTSMSHSAHPPASFPTKDPNNPIIVGPDNREPQQGETEVVPTGHQ